MAGNLAERIGTEERDPLAACLKETFIPECIQHRAHRFPIGTEQFSKVLVREANNDRTTTPVLLRCQLQ
jgi:hypothetical protein